MYYLKAKPFCYDGSDGCMGMPATAVPVQPDDEIALRQLKGLSTGKTGPYGGQGGYEWLRKALLEQRLAL